MGRMQVLIDVSAAAYQRAGIGRYTRQIVAHLGQLPDIALSYFYYGRPISLPGLPDPHWSISLSYSHRKYRLALLLQYYLGLALEAQGHGDLFHATDFVGPRFSRLPTVITVHDLSFISHPEWHSPLNALALRLLVPRAVSEATKVIAVSAWVAWQLGSLLKVPGHKVVVVPEGVDGRSLRAPPDWEQRLKALGLQPGYILSVGTWEPRKNFKRLLEAYSLLVHELGYIAPLVICGNPGWKYKEFLRALRRNPHRAHVKLVSGADDATLSTLYRGAGLFVLASLDEGFGLPLLEAMALGVPAAVSRAGSLPEVGGEAVTYFDPMDPADMARSMAGVLLDQTQREAMKQLGLVRSQTYTWQKAAENTLEVYKKVVG
jgi:glycosyltransferase involved in cell wall biosynthesis